MAKTLACRAGVPGSIPGRGAYFIDDKSAVLEKWGVEVKFIYNSAVSLNNGEKKDFCIRHNS